jgi:hypothetical protein
MKVFLSPLLLNKNNIYSSRISIMKMLSRGPAHQGFLFMVSESEQPSKSDGWL